METSSCRPPVSPLLKKYAGERTQHAKGITFHAHFSQPNAPILVLLAFVGKQFWLQLTCTYTLTCVWLTFDYAYFLMKILPLPSSYLFPANRALWMSAKMREGETGAMNSAFALSTSLPRRGVLISIPSTEQILWVETSVAEVSCILKEVT